MPRREAGYFGVPTPWSLAEGEICSVAKARRCRTLRGQRPQACTQAPRAGTGRSHWPLRSQDGQSVSGSRKTHADDERRWEVGPAQSTGEAVEQGRENGRGDGGGKGPDQGEPARAQRTPDTGPGGCAQCARAGTTSG